MKFKKTDLKKIARVKLSQAVGCGKIIKPKSCSVCEKAVESRKLHGHHEDYSKPLEVIWLCTWCHIKLHDYNRKSTHLLGGVK